MFKRFLVMALVLCMVSFVYAECSDCCTSCPTPGRILIIGDSGYSADGILDADGYVTDSDAPMVDMLKGMGYCVDTSGLGGAYWDFDFSAGDKLDALNNADLIIVSRWAYSGKYDNNRDDWNGLEVPLLMQNGHLARGSLQSGGSSKWGWTDGGNSKQSTSEMDMQLPGAPPLLDEVTIFCTDVIKNAAQNPWGNWPASAQIVGMYDGRPMLVDIPAGTDLDALNEIDPLFQPLYGVTGERRVYFGHWTYDSDYPWDTDISCAYKALFTTIVQDMIPEPATIALLGLGGLSLLRRKR